MKLPVDIKAIIDEATNIDDARCTALSVSVYLDATAPIDVQDYLRQAFASASASAQVSLSYIDERSFAPFPGDDMALIVAGLDERVGERAAQVRAAGVPAMVVTTLPELVDEIADSQGFAIPRGDLIAPKSPGCKLPEPCVLDDVARASLGERMGGWVIAACNDKRLAFALAFPFMRRPLSLEAVNSTALQNAGVGLLFVIPGADLPVMTLNQAKMLLMIAAAYGEELSMERVKELGALVGGAFACRAVARQLAGLLPGLGWALKAAVGYTGTAAMGRAAIAYYEGGGALGRLSDVVGKARDKVLAAAARRAACKAQGAGAKLAAGVRDRAASAVGGAHNAATSRFAAKKAD